MGLKNEAEKKVFMQRLIPFILCISVIILDQVTKILIVKTIPPYTILWSFFNDIIRVIHVKNLGVAFSMGQNWPLYMRKFVFSVIPLLVIIYVIKLYFKTNELSDLQRWCVTGIIGGGIGNLIDRIFRPDGVVDFIDVKFFGILGLDRWPTFNVADAAVVVCGIILIISFMTMILKNSKKNKK